MSQARTAPPPYQTPAAASSDIPAQSQPRSRRSEAASPVEVLTVHSPQLRHFFAASLLRLLGWLWAGLSLLAAAGVWYGGAAVRAWLIARAVDPVLTPLVLSALLYVLTAVVVMQGLTVGVGLNVLAGLTPRRPRWWS
jgi:hypothetical protein